MKTLTFRLHSKSFVERFSYPAGERQVRLTEDAIAMLKGVDRVIVSAILKSPEDIIDLALLRDAIQGVTSVPCVLLIPYLPYARADRRFVDGDCEGILTFSKLLFSMSWHQIITLDVHSKRALECLPNYVNVGAESFIRQAIEDFALEHGLNKLTVILPDKGAAARYQIPSFYGSNVYNIEIEQVICDKVREPETGKLLGFSVPPITSPAIIIDDLCDGGGTFLGIGASIDIRPLGLYVTHGIFSKGLEALKTRFSNIFSTDSFGVTSGVTIYHCFSKLAEEVK